MRYVKTSLLWLIHGCNAAWIGVLWGTHVASHGLTTNLLANRVFTSMILMTSVLHVARWHMFAREPLDTQATSAFDLFCRLRRTAELLHQGIPYLAPMVPSDGALMTISEKAWRGQPRFTARTRADLLSLLYTPQLTGCYALFAVVAFGYLLDVGFPSYRSWLGSIPGATPLLSTFAGFIGIYGLAMILLMVSKPSLLAEPKPSLK